MLYLYVITLLKSSKPVNNVFLACIPMFLIRMGKRLGRSPICTHVHQTHPLTTPSKEKKVQYAESFCMYKISTGLTACNMADVFDRDIIFNRNPWRKFVLLYTHGGDSFHLTKICYP